MTDTFTKGPWAIVQRKNAKGQTLTPAITGTTPHNFGPIATLNVRFEQDANAALICAAPDLLAAAKDAAREWRLHGQLTDSCRLLERAIEKAEGRS